MSSLDNRRQFITTTAAAGLVLAGHATDPDSKIRVAVIGHTGRGN